MKTKDKRVLMMLLVAGGMSVEGFETGYAEPVRIVRKAESGKESVKRKNMRFTDEFKKEIKAEIEKAVREDARSGLEKMIKSTPARDNIEMSVWGEFLFNYMGKSPTEYPVGAIEFPVGDEIHAISASKDAKEWVQNEVLPLIKGVIYEESRNYPLTRYAVRVENGKKVSEGGLGFDKEFSVDTDIRALSEIYPLGAAKENYMVYHTGLNYGVVVTQDYLEVLKGYHNETDTMQKVEGAKKGAVETISYVTLVRNVGGGTFKGKSLKDMKIYKNLAVDMRNGELKEVQGKDALRAEYKMFSLKPEELVYLELEETVVAVQTTYLECVSTGWGEINTAHKVDFSGMIRDDSGKVSVRNANGDTVEDYNMYLADEDDRLGTKEGMKNPFLIFASPESLPYERILGILDESTYGLYMTKETRDGILKEIEADMAKRGKGSEYTEYTGDAKRTARVLLIPTLLMIGLVCVGVRKIKKKSKKDGSEIDKAELLFPEE